MLDLKRLYAERVVYSIPGMEQARVREDLVYRTLGDEELALDIYYPPTYTPGTKLPAVVLVHGDWPPHIIRHSKDLGVYVSWGQLIAASGLAAVNFNHRSTERLRRVREAASDVAQAIGYLRFYADRLDLVSNRLCIWAFSAGMPLGMWAAMKDAPSYVRSIVAYYGVMDLRRSKGMLPDEVGEEELRDFSALHHLEEQGKLLAPMLIARAGRDNPGLNASIDRFAGAAKEMGASLELLEHPTGRHGFDVLNDDDRSRLIIRRSLDFVHETLLPA